MMKVRVEGQEWRGGRGPPRVLWLVCVLFRSFIQSHCVVCFEKWNLGRGEHYCGELLMHLFFSTLLIFSSIFFVLFEVYRLVHF